MTKKKETKKEKNDAFDVQEALTNLELPKMFVDGFKAYITNNNLEFKLNGEPSTLYGVMNAYESISPSNLSRFKGLGEMDVDELGVSTILPGERTLIRYTVENVKEEVATIRELESDKSKLLQLTGKINRKDLVGL